MVDLEVVNVQWHYSRISSGVMDEGVWLAALEKREKGVGLALGKL